MKQIGWELVSDDPGPEHQLCIETLKAVAVAEAFMLRFKGTRLEVLPWETALEKMEHQSLEILVSINAVSEVSPVDASGYWIFLKT